MCSAAVRGVLLSTRARQVVATDPPSPPLCFVRSRFTRSVQSAAGGSASVHGPAAGGERRGAPAGEATVSACVSECRALDWCVCVFSRLGSEVPHLIFVIRFGAGCLS